MATLLLDRGAKVDAIDGNGDATPLYLAGMNGHTECVRLLIDRGADPSIETAWGTVAEDAEQRGHAEVAALLRQHTHGW